MTLDEAIRHCEEVAKESRKEQNYWLEPRDKENMFSNVDFEDLAQNACDIAEENEQLAEWLRELKAYREAEKYKWNNHQVACLLADIFGDTCACNYNGNDEWLPFKCELLDACPNTVGVACWEQYLTHREVNADADSD